jgi:hypothetical protein
MALRIGFDRRIRLQWLDALLDHLLMETDPVTTRELLHELLAPDHPGVKARTNTVTVLMRMWAAVPPRHEALQQTALGIVRDGAAPDRRWLHWGMALLAFPVFAATASTVGRLLAVQGDLMTGQVKQRLAETFGQRSTLERASRRVISSVVEWGLLTGGERKGQLRGAKPLLEAPPDLQLWLLEAAFVANGAEEVEASQLLSAPELFPFHIAVRPGDLRNSERFEVHRQGMDMDVVALARH